MDELAPEKPQGYRHSLLWNFAFSSYWFATSYKWFILLFILLPTQVKDLVPGGEKNTWWGIIFGTGAVWAIVGPSIFGRLNETLGGKWRDRRRWLSLGSGLTVIALFTLVQAPNLWLLGLGYLLLQVSDDIGTGPYAGMVADSVPESERGYASSILGGLKLVGQIVSAVVALALKKTELIYIGIAAVNVLCAVWTIHSIKGLAMAPEQTGERGHFHHEWIAPFRDSDFVRVWFNRLIVSFAFACISAYTKNFLDDMFTKWMFFGHDLGSGKSAAIVLALTISFAGIIGSIYSAKVTDRIGKKPLLIGSGVLIALALVPIGLAPSFMVIWACVFVFGIGNGVYAAADWALISDVLPNPEKSSTEMGVWQSSETAVQIPAGVIMGAVIDQINKVHFGAGYMTMVWTAAALFFVSIFLVKGIKRTR